MAKLTVFTPTYNRRYILPKAYEALCRQTSRDFIWLIVDDGSDDGTGEMVQSWIEEARIPIQYHFQQNGGKMRAHNAGVSLCPTELFTCIDSDDYLVDDGVESILEEWESLKEKEHLAGIVAYRGRDPHHTMFGETFPCSGSASVSELYRKGFLGETTLVYRTDILSRYPFPVFEDEKFIPEAVAFDLIDRQYAMHIFTKVLTICEYRGDGLTRSVDKLRENNPKGWLLYYQQRIQDSSASVLRYKYVAHAVCFCWKLKRNPFGEIPASRAEIMAAFPGAFLLRLAGKL